MDGRIIASDLETMSGTPVFRGTRVPLQNLIDYLKGGSSIEEFLDDFPTVSREDALAILEQAKELILAQVA